MSITRLLHLSMLAAGLCIIFGVFGCAGGSGGSLTGSGNQFSFSQDTWGCWKSTLVITALYPGNYPAGTKMTFVNTKTGQQIDGGANVQDGQIYGGLPQNSPAGYYQVQLTPPPSGNGTTPSPVAAGTIYFGDTSCT